MIRGKAGKGKAKVPAGGRTNGFRSRRAIRLAWQLLFPAAHRTRDPRGVIVRRHNIHESVVQRAVKQAVRNAGIDKPVSCHTL